MDHAYQELPGLNLSATQVYTPPPKMLLRSHIRSQTVVHEMSNVPLALWWRFQGGRGCSDPVNANTVPPLHLRLRGNYRRGARKMVIAGASGCLLWRQRLLDMTEKWSHPMKFQQYDCSNETGQWQQADMATWVGEVLEISQELTRKWRVTGN